MSTQTAKWALRGAGALTLVLASVIPAGAQPKGNIRSISKITVKADRMGDFQAAVKDYIAVLKKANWDKSAIMWRAGTGPGEYMLVSFYEKWAELDVTRDPKLKDVSADLATISARINQCVEKTERIIDEIQPELSLPRASEVPKMIRTVRVRVKPDRVNDYLALVKSELLPAVKNSGLKSFLMGRTAYGAPIGEFRSSAPLDSWADLDSPSPIIKGLGGEAAWQKYLAKVTPMIVEAEYNVYRYVPELSYIVFATGASD